LRADLSAGVPDYSSEDYLRTCDRSQLTAAKRKDLEIGCGPKNGVIDNDSLRRIEPAVADAERLKVRSVLAARFDPHSRYFRGEIPHRPLVSTVRGRSPEHRIVREYGQSPAEISCSDCRLGVGGNCAGQAAASEASSGNQQSDAPESFARCHCQSSAY
jgi:hypothetical protein